MADSSSPKGQTVLMINNKVVTSDEECALVCMIVSNPTGTVRPNAWQKRVNDLIRALRDERNELTNKQDVCQSSHSSHWFVGTDHCERCGVSFDDVLANKEPYAKI